MSCCQRCNGSGTITCPCPDCSDTEASRNLRIAWEAMLKGGRARAAGESAKDDLPEMSR